MDEKLKILFDKIKKKIREQKEYNPLNPSFEKSKIVAFYNDVEKIVPRDSDIGQETFRLAKMICDLLKATIMMHDFYNKIYAHLRKIIKNSNLSQKELVQFLFASINRDYLLINQKHLDVQEIIPEGNSNNKTFSFVDMPTPKIPSPDTSVGEISSVGAIEGAVDSLNILLNYLKYFAGQDFTKDRTMSELKSIDAVLNLYINAQYLNTIKHDYEDIIWNNGFITLGNNRLLFDFFSHNELKLEYVGKRVMQQRVFDKFASGKYTTTLTTYSLKKRIKNCYVENGYLKYKLSDGKDREEEVHSRHREASIIAYYEFLKNVSFPKYKELDIEKTLHLFNLMSYLFYRSPNLDLKNTGVVCKKEFSIYPYKISLADLKTYLKSRSGLSSQEINSFLSLFVNNKNFINLWDMPFLSDGSDVLFALLPLTFPMTYNIIDFWLEEGGVSLDERGKHFEQYLVSKLQVKNPQGFSLQIVEQKKFNCSNGDSEEIDLLIKMSNTLIVAELKCIRYPMDVRDYYNAEKRLKIGCEQAKRKAEFMIRNHKTLKSIIGEYNHRNIQAVVITNYPLFTGFLRYGIPIIDAHSFESYFTGGFIFKKITSYENNVYSNEAVNATPLYTTEQEFNDNLKSYLINPPLVKMILDNTKIDTIKTTPKDAGFNIFTTYADIPKKQS